MHNRKRKQVPAPTAVLPFAGIRVHQIAPQHKARDFIVKTNGVVAHANVVVLRNSSFNLRCKLSFRNATLKTDLRRDASDQARLRVGQIIKRRLTEQYQRITHFVQVGVGTNCGKLRGPIAPQIGPEGFVIVPEEGVARHRGQHYTIDSFQIHSPANERCDHAMPLKIEALQETHFEQLHCVFDAVCRERKFMAFTEAGPKEQTFAYYGNILAGGHSHFVAVRNQQVVGWCDVLPQVGQMRSHSGVLGMAVAVEQRGLGVGKALIQAAVAKAHTRGLLRIELTVQSENQVAQALYRSVGFEQEGTLRNAWYLDGQHFDVHLMAKLL